MKRSLTDRILAFLKAAALALPFSVSFNASAVGANGNSGSPYVNPDDLAENEILHVPTGIKVTPAQMMNTLGGSRVIYVGEQHDNVEAHRVQLEIIRRLEEKYPGQIAVGTEMFRRSAQDKLDQWHDGNLTDDEFKKLFIENWDPGYEVYQPIFEYMKKHSIALIGLKPTKETENLVRKQLADPGTNGIPEMDENDLYHRAYFLPFFGAHDTSNPDVARFYRMMVLWDEAMAQSVAEFLADPKNKDKKLVVLAGANHVQYGFGIPKRAFRRMAAPYSIVIPWVAEPPADPKDAQKNDKDRVPLYPGDFLWKVPYIRLAPERTADSAPKAPGPA